MIQQPSSFNTSDLNSGSTLYTLEKQRKETVSKFMKAVIPFGAFIILLMGLLLYYWIKFIFEEMLQTVDKSGLPELFLFGLLVIIVPLLWLLRKRYDKAYKKYILGSDYFKNFKREIIAKLVKELNASIIYLQDKGVPESVFRESGFPLFADPVHYRSSELVKGRVGEASFQFAEVTADQVISSDGARQVTPLFKGVFFVIDLKKEVLCHTIVYPDTLKYFSKLLVGKMSEEDVFTKNNYMRIKLEDVAFEQYFEVYGTDQVESRYILSPALMSRLVDFRRHTASSCQFSIKDAKMYCAVHYSARKKMFSPPVFKPVNHLSASEEYITDMKLMLNIISTLNINAR